MRRAHGKLVRAYHACHFLSIKAKEYSTAVSGSRLGYGRGRLQTGCRLQGNCNSSVDVPLWRAVNEKVLQTST